MSEARKGPDETDESQYDSGIESLRSLRSLPEPTPAPASGPSDGGGPQPWTHPPGTAKEPEEKEDTDGERADSTYGSSSLTEPLSLLGDPKTEDPAPDSRLPAAGALSPQQLEALTYISEDGDTLIHLAVIHEAPAVLLYCLALLPQEVLDIQNNLYQTALHLAVHLDQPGAVRALVLKGASRVLQDRHGDTALHVACQRQHLACARCLLEGQPELGRGPPHSLDLQLQNWQGGHEREDSAASGRGDPRAGSGAVPSPGWGPGGRPHAQRVHTPAPRRGPGPQKHLIHPVRGRCRLPAEKRGGRDSPGPG
ncbi:NF-kappa-B inhibitor epsilon isoform X2 [Lagenorhynchus albirostris]|uniref:NF-kappa-B inhibitor epsilon isoform X2 n=1 Tax=Lagenorhynchus albirostris TaxID=27610 RepID=UPI0028EA64DA|nr:NF-kappa-B inhibitor epsilon isoform X2 [Lagenorhynchus albirostris]